MATTVNRHEGGLEWMRSYFGGTLNAGAKRPNQRTELDDVGTILIEHSYDTWSRQSLDQETRSLITLTITAALGITEMLREHLRGAHHIGVPREKIVDLLIHVGTYCGTPRASVAHRIVREVWQELDEAE